MLSGVFGDIDLRIQMEMLLIRGIVLFDATNCIQRIILPVMVVLLDFLLVPYFTARVACMFIQSYFLRVILVRYCYHTYIVIRALCYLVYSLTTYLIALHNEIRDTKYLIGTTLTNRGANA